MFLKKEEKIALRRLAAVEPELKNSINDVQEQFEDQLTAINENTDEIHYALDQIGELNDKIEKLSTRFDEIQLMLKEMMNPEQIRLSYDEQKVFLALYAFGDNGLMNVDDIARKSTVYADSIKQHIFNMMTKGVKISCEKVEGIAYFKLDNRFRELQTRKGIIEIYADVRSELFNSNLNKFFIAGEVRV